MNTKNTLIAIVALFATSATFAQVGIGTIAPHATAALDVESTTKGFLPPRMTDAQRDAIASPADGLTIYNTDENCLQWYNGIGWYDGCDASTFVAPVTGIPGNDTCSTASISVTPCSVVPGATLNDDATTVNGTEYDWTGATGFVDGGTTRALVEIGGQCWYRRNAVNTPSAYNPAPTWANNSDVGWSGDYTGGSLTNEGKLYQWSAAMNGDSTERAQGVCPTGWHVPSDCEWMYLEDTLGMSTTDQEGPSWRNSGNVGGKLSTSTRATSSSTNGSGTNSSGFTALLAGIRSSDGSFLNRGTVGSWWSSSEPSTASARRRSLGSSQAGVFRNSDYKALGCSVRCLKD